MSQTATPIITPTAAPPVPRKNTPAALLAASVSAAVAGALTAQAAWSFNPHVAAQLGTAGWHAVAGMKAAASLIGAGWEGFAAGYGAALVDAGWSAWWRVGAMWGAALTAGLGSFLMLNVPIDPIRHIRGRQLRTGEAALEEAKKTAAAEIGKTEPGIELIAGSGLRISQDRETKHFIIVGGTGSGKTVAVSHIATQAMARGDRLLVVDYKGLTEKLPGAVLIADPTDSRGMLWDIAADVRTRWDAEEIAARMIPDSGKDPFWANGSRAILAGLMTYCINTKPGRWGFGDIADLMRQPIESYAAVMKEHYPQALAFVSNAESNTTDGLIKNMSVTAKFVFQLAAAEQAAGDRQRISFRNWIENPNHPARSVILKINDAFASLSASYNQAIIGVICSRVSALPDVAPDRNRVWIVADEFPRLGKVIGWDQFLAVGRSKGLRIVTVVQSVSQLRQTFGEHETDTWTSIVGTLILGRNDGATARWYCDLAGEREVWTPQQNVSASAGGFTVGNSYGRERLPVLIPAQCSSDLGVRDGGCESLLYGFDNIHVLRWRFLGATDGWTKQRADFKPAPWTLAPELQPVATDTAPPSPATAEHEPAMSAMTAPLSTISFAEMEPLEIDVYTIPKDEQQKESEQENEATNKGYEATIEDLTHDAIGEVAGEIVGLGLHLMNEIDGQEVGEVEQVIQPKPQQKKRFVSRKNREQER